MYKKLGSLFLVLDIVIATSSGYSGNRFLRHPNKTLYADEGGNVTAIWEFQIEHRDRTRIEDFIFGEWVNPGYVKYKLLYMDTNYKVQPRPGYNDKVHYEVNISQPIKCSARVTLLKLIRKDFRTYGIDILIGLDRSPLINTFELRAPPRIIEFSCPWLLVAPGNKTTFECQAKGIPEPFVSIKKGNKILCNATSHCQWAIKNVTIEDEGEYECIAKQDERSDKKSKRLKVHSKDDGQSARESSITLIITFVAVVAVLVVAMCLVCAMWFYKRARKKLYHFNNVEEKPFKI